MARLNPYMSMPGKCREMMTFYAECLDAKVNFQTVAESPVACQMPAQYKDQILHSVLEKGELVIMASDMSKTASISGNTVQLCVNCTSVEEINGFFNKLREGGTVDEELQTMFWGGLFGALTDKFGVHWMFNYEAKE
ncbi:VOC family protein [Flavihumibacter fluvii]|uniref:VOC family protein n=1 Tax=Flavihumibacter fluvii TaxID=2838157 RepID=UPI001BDDDA9E|nr:VOC family protein [Flavihumibacter fluvii]ULQ53093.1 VOC family protein [Flavihumibacter fluvii]